MKIPKWQHKLAQYYKRGKLVSYFVNNAAKTYLYGLKNSENIGHFFQARTFFRLSSNLYTSCLSTFKIDSKKYSFNRTVQRYHFCKCVQLNPAQKHIHQFIISEAVARRWSVKKVFLEISQNSQENTCACNFIKKETLEQVLSCESCEISKNTFLHRTPLVAASMIYTARM